MIDHPELTPRNVLPMPVVLLAPLLLPKNEF